MMPSSSVRRELPWFVVVGTAAAAVHWVVVVALVNGIGLAPLVANVGGWLVALAVSFTGHHRLTFGVPGGADRRAWHSALPRFALVSAGGFMVNETVYAVALRWTSLRYDVLLGAVLVAVAALTYLLSRHWAFARTRRPPAAPPGPRATTTSRARSEPGPVPGPGSGDAAPPTSGR